MVENEKIIKVEQKTDAKPENTNKVGKVEIRKRRGEKTRE